MSEAIRISEIFGPTIQGEGALIGQPTVFVRTGGCDYRCSWCDTLYAVESRFRHTWKPMTANQVWDAVSALSGGIPLTVSLSGGNPATQPLQELIALGQAENYRFALETQASVARPWFSELDVLTLSPKPPSSGMDTDWEIVKKCIEAAGEHTNTVLKVVVFDDADYAYAKEVYHRFPSLPFFLQPGNHTPPNTDDGGSNSVDIKGVTERTDWLINKVNSDRWFDVRVLPQLHVMIWGNLRGV